MPTALITGGAGFIGSRVAHRFVDAGYDVVVFDSLKQYLVPEPTAEQHNLLVRLADIFERIELQQGDTLNKDFLRRVLVRARPDIIVHMAALPLATLAIEHTEEAFDSILRSTVNIMDVMRDFQHTCTLVYASSSMVYGDFLTDRVTEESPTDPKDIYGSLKLAGEFVARGYMKRYGLDVRIVRPTAVYGPFDGNQRVLYHFIRRALDGEKLTVHGDGSTRLDFTFVDDTANGIFLAATSENGAAQTFNIARGEARSLADAIDYIREFVGDIEIEFGEMPAHVPERGTLDIGKARRLLGFEPEYDLRDGLQLYVSHLREHRI